MTSKTGIFKKHRPEFEKEFPRLVRKLEKASEVYKKGYEWAKLEFDRYVKSLGTWFQDIVNEFNKGLIDYQNKFPKSYKWKMIRYRDGAHEDC